jgi:hypothetical protein
MKGKEIFADLRVARIDFGCTSKRFLGGDIVSKKSL